MKAKKHDLFINNYDCIDCVGNKISLKKSCRVCSNVNELIYLHNSKP